MAKTELTLKLRINKTTNKVVFAEAGKEVFDFLFGLLDMSLGALSKHPKGNILVGSFANIYKSLGSMADTYFSPKQIKASLLNRRVHCSAFHFNPLLPPAVDKENIYYTCYDRHSGSNYFSYVCGTKCRICMKPMCFNITFVEAPDGYVNGAVVYRIMDDLTVAPISGLSSFSFLFNGSSTITDVDALEERVVKIGVDESMLLLKASMQSTTVLTDVFLRAPKSEPTAK